MKKLKIVKKEKDVSILTMERKGILYTDSQQSDNQCKDVGHKHYSYNVKVVFASKVELDKDRFIVDHSRIDQIVQEAFQVTSCEGMHIDILEALVEGLEDQFPVAIKLTIVPINPEGVANIGIIWSKKSKFINYL